MEKQPFLYQQLLKEALEEYNEWLKSIQRKENCKYCVKCRSRIVLDGLNVCKHCHGGDLDYIKPRMRKKIKQKIVRKTKTGIKRNRSHKSKLKG